MAPAPALAPPALGARYALIVAIDSYPEAKHQLPDYKYDVDSLRVVLTGRFSFPAANIVVLRNANATREAILDAFHTHLAKAGPDGVAVFYFIGHGLQLDRDYSVVDEQGNADQALFVWGANGRGTIILDDELNVLFRDLTAGRRVAILDACYSGSGLKGFKGWAFIKSLFAWLPSGQARDPKPIPVIMNTSFSSDGKPAEIPKHFISDLQVLVDLDSLPLVFISAAAETEPAFSEWNYPKTPQSHAIFSYNLEHALQTVLGSSSFTSVTSGVARAVHLWDECVQDSSMCQTPQVHGGLQASSIAEVLGRP